MCRAQFIGVERVYVDAHEPCLGARRAKLSLQYASKIKSLQTSNIWQCLITNMKLIDVRPNAICTFGLHIKQFLTASNFSDVLETPLYFVLPPWCIKPAKIVLIWCIWRTIAQMHPFISSYSWKYETGTVITFRFIQMVHGMEILWLVLQFFHQTA